jgi:hypothetical protein
VKVLCGFRIQVLHCCGEPELERLAVTGMQDTITRPGPPAAHCSGQRQPAGQAYLLVHGSD